MGKYIVGSTREAVCGKKFSAAYKAKGRRSDLFDENCPEAVPAILKRINAWRTVYDDVPCEDRLSYVRLHERHV